MKLVLSFLLLITVCFGFNKPIESKIHVHAHDHIHIQGTQHVHEHMHVETNLTLFFKTTSLVKEPLGPSEDFFAHTEYIPDFNPHSIFRPPIS